MKTTTLLLTFIFCCGAAAQAQQALTLAECRDKALQSNKATAIAERTEEKAGHEAKSYFANFFPKISATGAYLYANRSMEKAIAGSYLPTYVPNPATGELDPNLLLTSGSPVVGADGNPIFNEYAYFPDMALSLQLSGTYFAGVRAEQPVYMGGKIHSAYKMSLIGKDISSLNRRLTRAEVIVKTDEAYWLHLKALESAKVAAAFQKIAAELLHNVADGYSAGLKTKNDVLKVQVHTNKAALQLQQADNAIRLSRMNLCQLMGLPLLSEITVSDSLEDNLSASARTTDYTARPEYAMLEKQVALKRAQVKLVRSDFLPNIGVAASYGYLHGLELNGTPLADRASFSALLSVKIPLFHWGDGLHKIRAAAADAQIAQLQRDDLNEKMALELRKALDKCEEWALEVKMTARSLEQAEENMHTSRNQYEAGMEPLANYLEAQTLWQQAWLEMINAKINQRLYATYYQKAVGEL